MTFRIALFEKTVGVRYLGFAARHPANQGTLVA